VELTQRWLVNRTVRTADAEILTKYVFPFWDREWKVVLTLLDRFGAPPEILHAPIHVGAKGQPETHAKGSDAVPLNTVEPGSFRELFHFDPWWVFRGIGGVALEIKEAITETNIAHPFHVAKQSYKVHDVEFETSGEKVKAIVAKDHLFKVRRFAAGELNLDEAWP